MALSFYAVWRLKKKTRIFLAAILDLCKLQEFSKVDSLSFKPDWFYDTRKGQETKNSIALNISRLKLKPFSSVIWTKKQRFWLCGVSA